jgi:hypothetical protein
MGGSLRRAALFDFWPKIAREEHSRMIHEVDPNPEELGAGTDMPQAANVVAWPEIGAEPVESSGDYRELLYRLVVAALAIAVAQVEIRTTFGERFAICASCGSLNPVGVEFQHRPDCRSAEVIALVERLKMLGGLESNSDRREDTTADYGTAADGNRPRPNMREPWDFRRGPELGTFTVIDRDAGQRAIVRGRFVDRLATAERIAACVNFCAGYSTAFLKGEHREDPT